MRQLLFLLILALALPLYGADRVRYVDTGSGGGDGTTNGTGAGGTNAYASLQACIAAEVAADADLTDEGNFVIHLNRTNGGGADTTAAIIDGFTADSTHYVKLIQDDFPATGIPDETKYYLNATNTTSLLISDNWVRIAKLQVKPVMTANNTAYGIRVALVGVSNFYFGKCLIWTSSPGTGNISGIYINNSSATVTIYDSIVTGFVNGTNTVFQGVRINSAAAVNLYNDTVYNNYQDIVCSAGAVTVKNCAVGASSDDFVGTFAAIENCLSDDGDGTSPQTPSGGDWANEFTNAAGLDFSLVAGGNAIGHGTDDPGAGLYSDDIIGTARSSTWDIGAYEYAPTSPPTKAATPGPAHEAVGQTVNVNLTWVDGGGAITYDVYWGTVEANVADANTLDAEFVQNQVGLSYDPGVLAYETEYFWRIDSVNVIGTTTGDVWSFTTGAAPAGGGTIGPIIYYRNRLRQR